MQNWRDDIKLPAKQPDTEYAFILFGSQFSKTVSQSVMMNHLESENSIKYVATPNTNSFIVPGTNYETLLPLLKKRGTKVKFQITIAIFVIILFAGIAFFEDSPLLTINKKDRALLILFGIIPFIQSVYQWYILRNINEKTFKPEAEELLFEFWLRWQKVQVIYGFLGLWGLIYLLQIFVGVSESILGVGLVKQEVLSGEYWRLLTASFLHVSIVHLIFNGGALYVIGRFVTAIVGPWSFLFVFVFSCITGSIFSLYLLPEITLVGASGGILGLIGFALVMCIRFKPIIPTNYIRNYIEYIILISLLGIGLYDVIDNAAHVGGFVGGAGIGFLLIPHKNSTIPFKPDALRTTLGVLALLFYLTAATALLQKLL